ncbi:CRISPR-associated endonuclease Cas2 [Streptomyces lacrimifluminis]|uniref:CRISPR-associated endonuclease Cas2 n=1 Tax=Streptomyces lacrimifluminis TaxID=1500077 RepID=UPI001668A58A
MTSSPTGLRPTHPSAGGEHTCRTPCWSATTSPTTTGEARSPISWPPQGARVQYSIFEVTLPTKKAVQQLRGTLRKLIDRDEDQIRIYPLPVSTLNELIILGNRRLEERADFWIV